MNKAPAKDVIKAFGGKSEAINLPGGEGSSYRVDDIVLKPVYSKDQTVWNANILSNIRENGFRVSRPIKSINGTWTYKGWHAFKFQEGEEVRGNWNKKIEVSKKFHEALREIQKPDFIGNRNNPWESADISVWQGDLSFKPEIRKYTNSLIKLKKPVCIQEQLIHGDMTGNILFHQKLKPLVIDFSPYWRPANYAIAIIITDSIVWEKAPDSLLNSLSNTHENNQLLIRAILWRIKTSDVFLSNKSIDLVSEIFQYKHLIKLIENRVIVQNKF